MNDLASALDPKSNGAQPQTQQIPVDQVATMTLEFLSRITMSPHERVRYSICEQFLTAIQRGELLIQQPATNAPAPETKQ